jgi:hypothetical protein
MEILLAKLRELDASDQVSMHYFPNDEELVMKIVQLANQELILDGQCHWDHIHQLELAGYPVKALSKDSFGWLMGGIHTKKGIVRYG